VARIDGLGRATVLPQLKVKRLCAAVGATAVFDPKRKINLCDEVLCRGFLEHDQDAPSEERTKPQAMRNARPQ
jgi:hypothetical protein